MTRQDEGLSGRRLLSVSILLVQVFHSSRYLLNRMLENRFLHCSLFWREIKDIGILMPTPKININTFVCWQEQFKMCNAFIFLGCLFLGPHRYGDWMRSVFVAVAGKGARSVVLVELGHVRKVSERAPLVWLENTTVYLDLVRVFQDIVIHKECSSV